MPCVTHTHGPHQIKKENQVQTRKQFYKPKQLEMSHPPGPCQQTHVVRSCSPEAPMPCVTHTHSPRQIKKEDQVQTGKQFYKPKQLEIPTPTTFSCM
ncbi:hypothetical protein ACFX15_018191 [Malus domestica]